MQTHGDPDLRYEISGMLLYLNDNYVNLSRR